MTEGSKTGWGYLGGYLPMPLLQGQGRPLFDDLRAASVPHELA